MRKSKVKTMTQLQIQSEAHTTAPISDFNEWMQHIRQERVNVLKHIAEIEQKGLNSQNGKKGA
jgi:hypothetical protein